MHISCEFTISSSPRKGQCRMYNVMSWTASQSLHNGLCYCQILFVALEKEALAPLKSKQALNSKHAHTKVERFCSYARFSGERSNFSKKSGIKNRDSLWSGVTFRESNTSPPKNCYWAILQFSEANANFRERRVGEKWKKTFLKSETFRVSTKKRANWISGNDSIVW